MNDGVRWETVERQWKSELANAIADRIKEAERSLPAGTLEHKEVRNCARQVLNERLSLVKCGVLVVADLLPAPESK